MISVLHHTSSTSALKYSGSAFDDRHHGIALVYSTSDVARFHRLTLLHLWIHPPHLCQSSPSCCQPRHHLGYSLPLLRRGLPALGSSGVCAIGLLHQYHLGLVVPPTPSLYLIILPSPSLCLVVPSSPSLHRILSPSLPLSSHHHPFT